MKKPFAALDRLGFLLFTMIGAVACLGISGASLLELARSGRLPTFISTGYHRSSRHPSARWWTSTAEPWTPAFTSSLLIYGMFLCLGVVLARLAFKLLFGHPLVRDAISRALLLAMLAQFVLYLAVSAWGYVVP